MKFSVILRTAIKALAANRKRTILTMVGIVIGIASVIAIISIGKGFQKSTTESITNSSSGNVETDIMFEPNDSTLDLSRTTVYSKQDLLLAKKVDGVKKAYVKKAEGIEDSDNVDLVINDEKLSVTYELLTNRSPNTIAGRSLDKEDNMMKHKVAVVGSVLANKIAPSSKAAIGRGIKINNEVFTIVGVLKTDSNSLNTETTNLYVPKSTYKRYVSTSSARTTLCLVIKNDNKASRVTNEVVSVLKKSGSMRLVGDYSYFDMGSLADSLGKALGGITYFVSAVAGISLFIAGVGIMNMMYISVSERTKEIGIRRALGAKKRDILLQFLLEGILITLFGGFIGFLFGIGLAKIVGVFIKISPVVDMGSILLSVGISIFIGLVFSVMPARTATQKDLIDIMK